MRRFDEKWVYLSGPMTGKPDWNRKAFDEAVGKCYDLGAYRVWNPALDAPLVNEEPKPHEHYMLMCLSELSAGYFNADSKCCESRYDVLLLLDGWEDSDGALVEKKVAESIGMEVLLASDVFGGGE